MSKVYLHDEATGVTVEGYGTITKLEASDGTLNVDPAEFRAVIEGGLRWMLETHAGTFRFWERNSLEHAIIILKEKGR